MAVLLNVEKLRKYFGPEPVLSSVSFQVRTGDKIGLVGPNGCGKTTLLNILVGQEETERGFIEKPSDVSIGYLEQRPIVVKNRTLLEEARLALASWVAMQKEAEQIAQKLSDTSLDSDEHERLAKRYDRIHEELLHRDAYNLEYRVERILHGVGFQDNEFTKQISMLSGGELNRLGLAKLLLEEPEIMLLDEPSNHLDLAATEWLEEFLKNTSAAIILVSHDRYFLDRVTNRTLELFRGTIDDYPGNFSKYQLLKEERLAVQTRTYEKYVEEVEKAKDFIRRHHYGMKAAQAEDRRKKLERLEAEPVDLPKKIVSPPMSFPKTSRTGDIVFRIENLAKGFDLHSLFKNLTINIERGERWAILGPNGCGKTTFLKCLLGQLKPDQGTVHFGQGVRVGYFDQHLHVLDDQQLVVDAIRPPKKVFEDLERRKLLGAFGLTGDQQLQTVASLSGGQRCRAALAKLAADDPNVMILDEPTNHLDLWARAALENAIQNFDGTVLFISHDRYFVDRVADHLLIIQPNAKFRVLEGNYSDFRHLVAKGLIQDPFLPGALDEEPDSLNKSNNSSKNKENLISKKSVTKIHSKNSAKQSRKDISNNSNNLKNNKTNWPAKSSSAKENAKMTTFAPKKNRENIKNLDHPIGLGTLAEQDKNSKWAEAAFKEEQGRINPKNNKSSNEKKKRKFPFRKTSDIEEEIFMRETQIMTINDELLRPEILRNGEKIKELQAELCIEEEALKRLYEHWEEAAELNW
ncbi:MAG: ABC-F family ATP-binding cassette domain-containing protein [Planctomycetia bacterium]|nr:ABC-F family ATP-binding cassette domain-containing protein [Planctomycetia bacterium]